GMWAARYRTHWLGSTPLVDNDAVPAPMSHGHVWRVLGVGLLLWALPLVLIVATLGREHVLAQQAVFFGQVSVVTFGGAYAELAYVAQQAVEARSEERRVGKEWRSGGARWCEMKMRRR